MENGLLEVKTITYAKLGTQTECLMGDSKIVQAFPLEIAFATQALRFITFKQNMKRNFGGYSKVIR